MIPRAWASGAVVLRVLRTSLTVIGEKVLVPLALFTVVLMALLPGVVAGALLGMLGSISTEVMVEGGPGSWFAGDLRNRLRPALGAAALLLSLPCGLLAGALTGPIWFAFLSGLLARDWLSRGYEPPRFGPTSLSSTRRLALSDSAIWLTF